MASGGQSNSTGGGGGGSSNYDLSFKILLIGDSGVGKSSLLVTFISNSVEDLSPTIGVDFKIKLLKVGEKKIKLTIWDTAGQERFRTLTSSYYRGAQGIVLVYDVTRRETFTNLSDVWAKEVELYSTNQDCVKMLVGNKVDKDSERVVSREEGMNLSKDLGCLFVECSARTRENVEKCFEELALKVKIFYYFVYYCYFGSDELSEEIVFRKKQKDKVFIFMQIMEVPSLLEEGSTAGKRNILKQKQEQQTSGGGCCS
ncbi:OLC1v1034453C1 [Oldenlandia corymbosa var. corymbosa]|uniref:OLC1v1034453C1 n=1 Tax=Oldenlandia corymbosa var. corymbosa TaxID=529605 RepID=A0AAV1CT94_OLDCO|nr:OLC1v1034453C1 [Oldenlandia corymbosa var. corymbosa]